MKVKILLIIGCSYTINTYANTICGVEINDAPEISYGTINKNTGDGAVNWAIGTGCAGKVDNTIDVPDMCETVYIAGRAGVGTTYPHQYPSAETELTGNGAWCWCRRTHIIVDGVLTESSGQWVNISTQSNCPLVCANSVITNSNGLRNAIMLLPES